VTLGAAGSPAEAGTAGFDPAEQKVVPLRHPGRWAAATVVALFVVMLVHTLFFSHVKRGGQTQSRYQWNVIDQYFLTKPIMLGVLRTLEVTALAMILGIVIGVILAVMRLSPNPIMSGAAWIYTWFFRGTPVYVQILFWYYVAYLYPSVAFGVPFWHSFFSVNLVNVSGIAVGVLALGLNEGAYMAEIVRAGIISVDHGQTEAAHSLGMSRLRAMRRIVLPQAMRLIVPVTGNETISMLKTSSLLATIAVPELLYEVQAVYDRTYQTVPLLIVASLWYLAVTTILTIFQYYLERHYARGSANAAPPAFLDQLVRNALSPRQRWFGRPNQVDSLLEDNLK
jgi:polar amino acid transport system permease protein